MTTTLQANRHQIMLGVVVALVSSFFYGLVSIVAKKIVDDVASPLVAAAFSMAMGTVILAVLFHRHVVEDYARAPRRGWILMALAGLGSTWGVIFWFLALKEAPVVLVTPVTGVFPLVSLLLTHLFLQRLERVTWRIFAGAVLVVVGVGLIAAGGT